MILLRLFVFDALLRTIHFEKCIFSFILEQLSVDFPLHRHPTGQRGGRLSRNHSEMSVPSKALRDISIAAWYEYLKHENSQLVIFWHNWQWEISGKTFDTQRRHTLSTYKRKFYGKIIGKLQIH